MEIKYNKDGYLIQDFDKWSYYENKPKLYRKNKIKAYSCLLIPIFGILATETIFNKMGLTYC